MPQIKGALVQFTSRSGGRDTQCWTIQYRGMACRAVARDSPQMIPTGRDAWHHPSLFQKKNLPHILGGCTAEMNSERATGLLTANWLLIIIIMNDAHWFFSKVRVPGALNYGNRNGGRDAAQRLRRSVARYRVASTPGQSATG